MDLHIFERNGITITVSYEPTDDEELHRYTITAVADPLDKYPCFHKSNVIDRAYKYSEEEIVKNIFYRLSHHADKISKSFEHTDREVLKARYIDRVMSLPDEELRDELEWLILFLSDLALSSIKRDMKL